MNKSDDIINRRDVINTMWKVLFDYENLIEKQFIEHKELKLEDWFRYRIFVKKMYIECMKTILSLPSVDKLTGEWIQNDNGTYSRSVCHSWIPEEQHYYAQFCLYCGARMIRKNETN